MNGRARAIGSGLLVTATSVALVGVATAAADDAPSHPEAARAASIRTGRSTGLRAALDAALPAVDPAVRAKDEQLAVARFTAAANTARWYAAATANLQQQAAAATRTMHRASSGGSGAYQFMPGTWNTNAAAAGRPDLVGVNPAAASPADQDAMAQHLLAA